MKRGSFVIRVEKVKKGSSVPVGLVSTPITQSALIGRHNHCDFRLADSTVAGEHILLEASEQGFTVQVLTERGTTFVNGDRVAPQDTATIEASMAWLQLGRVLLSVSIIETTIPFEERMSLPPLGAAPTTAWLAFQSDPTATVWLKGQPMSLYPSAARVLAMLCQSPGQIVSHERLKKAMAEETHLPIGGNNLAQAITYIRNAFLESAQEGQIDLPEIKRLVEACIHVPATDIDDADLRDILRLLIENIRGKGYRLRLNPDSVAAS